MGKMVDSTCEGCCYLTEMHGNGVIIPACYYSVIMKVKRPCPPGEGCTVKNTSRGKPRPFDVL